MKKLLLISSIFLSLSINAQQLIPVNYINQPSSADSFWGGYTFAYATSGTPHNGALMSFGGFNSNNYDCQLSANYFQSQLAFRTRNGDMGTWNPWTNIVTVGPGSAQNYLTKFGAVSDLANSIIYDDGVHVGIGTTSPIWKFVVSKNNAAGLEIDPNEGTVGKIGIYAYNRSNSQYMPLHFEASNYEFNGGNVGIGTITPLSALNIKDNNSRTTFTGTDRLGLTIQSSTTATSYTGLDFIGATNNVGNNPLARIAMTTTDIGSMLQFGTSNFWLGGITNTAMTIYHNGNVGIGTTALDPTDAKLSVNGAIHAKEVRVDMTGLADYVFHPSYNLMPLTQVEQYVKTNSHLPQMPSAAEVSKNGMNMGDMQNKLLQKVEELTLYIIELQKTNEKQNAKINELEKKIK